MLMAQYGCTEVVVLVKTVSPVSHELDMALLQKIDGKTKPLGSLGQLEDLALRLGRIQERLDVTLSNPHILVFAGDHGIAAEGVSPYPQEVTRQMIYNYLAGGAAINVFTQQNEIKLLVVDAGVNFEFEDCPGLINRKVALGTANYLHQPAMTPDQCRTAMAHGAALIEEIHNQGCNIVGFGEMGISNTSSAALLMHRFCDIPLEDCVGRGTGLDDFGVSRKTEILLRAAARVQPTDPFDVLCEFGGFELAMMCGAMLEAASRKMVILVDGFIVTSTLLAAAKIQPAVVDYCIFSHQSNEQGHKLMLKSLGAKPVLKMGLRLGEGTGAALVYPLVKSAVGFLNGMASFESAGVSSSVTHA